MPWGRGLGGGVSAQILYVYALFWFLSKHFPSLFTLKGLGIRDALLGPSLSAMSFSQPPHPPNRNVQRASCLFAVSWCIAPLLKSLSSPGVSETPCFRVFFEGHLQHLGVNVGNPWPCYRGHLGLSGRKLQMEFEKWVPGPSRCRGPKSAKRSRKRVKIDNFSTILTLFRLCLGLFGLRGRKGPETYFRTLFATFGPKGPNDPCSGQKFSQGERSPPKFWRWACRAFLVASDRKPLSGKSPLKTTWACKPPKRDSPDLQIKVDVSKVVVKGFPTIVITSITNRKNPKNLLRLFFALTMFFIFWGYF